jgi:hypothetical protein
VPYDELDKEEDDSDASDEEDFLDFGILKQVVDENGEICLEVVEDEDINDTVGQLFEEKFNAEFDDNE